MSGRQQAAPVVIHLDDVLPKNLSQSLKMVVGLSGWGRISQRPYKGSPAVCNAELLFAHPSAE